MCLLDRALIAPPERHDIHKFRFLPVQDRAEHVRS